MPSSYDSARNDLDTVAKVLDLWPSAQELSRDLGLKHLSHARMFRIRNKIPGWHWDAVISAAERRGLPLSKSALVKVHGNQRIIGAPAWASEIRI